MTKENNINWFHWFIGFVCGFMVAVLTINLSFAAYEPEQVYYITSEQRDNIYSLKTPITNDIIGLNDTCPYMVFYSAERDCCYVWFMSTFATFRFTDRNPAKDLYCFDTNGVCVPLDENFNVVYDPHVGGRESLDVAYYVPDQFNADRSSIRFIYSSIPISVSFVERKNLETAEIYLKGGFQIGIDYIPEPEPTFEDRVIEYLHNILEEIKRIPHDILEGIREILSDIFIPNSSDIEADINDLKKSIFDSVGFDIEELEATLSNVESEPIQDVYIDLKIGDSTQRVKVFDTKFLIVGVNYFRPYIRGFIMLLMFFFVLNQISYVLHIGGFSKGGGEK